MNKQIEEMARIAFASIDETDNAYYGLKTEEVLTKAEAHSVAEAIYNAGYRKQEWISVEDRLPSNSDVYLICQKSDKWSDEVIQSARFSYLEQKFRGAQSGCFMEYVTHWMPLPEPPKGGEG